jgi:hypothetical protein
MMNPSYTQVIAASDGDRLDMFLSTAGRLGTAVENVEKDFWVCWTLDALFNGAQGAHPRLLFKGGTSLSKSFGLIDRFSEDIDITVFRDDLGQDATIEDLEALGTNRRRARLDAIRDACSAYINGAFLDGFTRALIDSMTAGRMPAERYRVEADEADPDRQTLLFWYPVVTAGGAGHYIRSAVRIEAGAKSALDPNVLTTVKPFVADSLPELDLRVGNITTVQAQRTFWDKIVILHGLRNWHDRRGLLRHGGQRVSRHYYDVFRLLQSVDAEAAVADRELANDCARHARMFFNNRDFDLDHAVPGTLTLAPSAAMLEPLQRDYAAMAGMIMDAAPPFHAIIDTVSALEARLNTRL